MKASKKVMESVIVSGLALTLAVTAVTGNGVNIAAKDAADTQFVNNGIAGVASAMNEYELESADYLDRYISVEKTNAALVAATADGTVISGNDTKKEETTEKETASEEEQEWQNKLMAKVDDFLYVREKADSDSEIVGKMYKGDRAVVKEAGDTWTKIESGNVTGYVKNEYCVTGTDALNYAKNHCETVAKISIDGLRIRKAPDTDAEVVKTVASGEHMDVNTGSRTFIDLEHQPRVSWPGASRSLAQVVLMGQSPVEITVEAIKMLRQSPGNLPCPDSAMT